ncbi:thiol-disulfide oxidoreductase ResA [Tuberibacillus calidus]|jgi:peroxiredoxin|uniref:thiol-disulfide oxidoreductase ResA n=1 Tax=Tuberibacillus calidus TaxID=340097 RepID=UPI0004095597|nr:thiol-disulfide oxidoreductase ResA [Tuberibacillus calidus]
MKNRKLRLVVRTVILIMIIAAVGYTLFQVLHSKDALAEGDTAPDFALKDLQGRTVHLKDLRGKGVMLNFWGSWCDPCKEEMPFINEAYKKKVDGVEVLAVNIRETKLVVQNFVDHNQLSFPVLLDTNGFVTDNYKVVPIPTTFLIDKNGKIVKILTRPMASVDEVLDNMKLIQP